MKTINVKKGIRTVTLPAIFEGTAISEDGGRFFVASTEGHKANNTATERTGVEGAVLICFGTEELKDPTHPQYSDYFAFMPEDSKAIIAAQLREMADWFEQQALTGEEKSGQYDALIAGTGPNDA